MENEEQFISKNFFKASFNKQDVTKLREFKEWKSEIETEGNKVTKLLNQQIIIALYVIKNIVNIV